MKKLISIVLILGLPALIYFLYIGFARNTYIPVHIHGPKTALGTKSGWGKKPDTLYHVVSLPKTIQLDSNIFKNKMTLVAYIDYGANTPVENQRMEQILRIRGIFNNNPRMQIWLNIVTQDGAVPANLDSFMRANFTKMPMEVFASVFDAGTYYQWAKEQLLLEDKLRLNNETGIPQTNKSLIIDNLGRIRGYYDMPVKKSVDDINGDMRALMVEIAGKALSKKPNQK